MKRRDFLKTLAASSALAGTAGFSRIALADGDPLKVAFVYVGPVGDYGWTYEHDQGRKYMVKQLGDRVKTTYVENVPETNDAVRVIRELAAKGNKLIYTTSFGFMNPTMRVARQFRTPCSRAVPATSLPTMSAPTCRAGTRRAISPA